MAPAFATPPLVGAGMWLVVVRCGVLWGVRCRVAILHFDLDLDLDIWIWLTFTSFLHLPKLPRAAASTSSCVRRGRQSEHPL
jgi:hypothetical protein